MPPTARCPRGTAGAAAIELALVLLVLLLCVLGLFEFGRALWLRATLSYAVQAAARCAQTNASLCGSTAQIQSFAAGAAPGLGLDPTQFTVTAPGCGIQVSVSMPFRFAVPWLSPSAMQLSAQACYPS
jgi:hypothetical protein